MPMPPTPAFTVWLTGLPGSGKSTIAHDVAAQVRALGLSVEVIDSGKIRKTPLGASLGFSKHDRDNNVRRHGLAARLLVKNGVVAIVAAVSPYRATRDQIRDNLGDFVEVWVSTPKAVCIDRDTTGMWAKALQGQVRNFTGVDDPYEPPTTPELTIDASAHSREDASAEVMLHLQAAGLLPEHTVEHDLGEDQAFVDTDSRPGDSG